MEIMYFQNNKDFQNTTRIWRIIHGSGFHGMSADPWDQTQTELPHNPL